MLDDLKTSSKNVWDRTKAPVLATALTATSLYALKQHRHVTFLQYFLKSKGLFDLYYAQSDADVLRLIARYK